MRDSWVDGHRAAYAPKAAAPADVIVDFDGNDPEAGRLLQHTIVSTDPAAVSNKLHSRLAEASAAAIEETSILTTHARISPAIFTLCLALAALRVGPDRSTAQASEIGMQGRWMYTTEVVGATEAVQAMATTAAVEDDNVWLLLTCSPDRQTTVSIMHVEAFSYPLQSRVNLSLGIDAHPTLTMSALTVNEKQLSLDPGSSYALLPLLLAGDRSFASVPDSRGEAHSYSFVLKPNDVALSDIRAQCLDH